MTLRPDLPVWRSLMYCPTNNPRFVDKAHARGADAIILDLEDAVPEKDKAAARGMVQEAAAKVGRAGADVCVRINRPPGLAFRDIEAAVSANVTALFCTKLIGPDQVQLYAELCEELERARGLPVGPTKFVAMVETAAALVRVAEIARAHPRIVALSTGGEDMATSLGMSDPDSEMLYQPKVTGLIAARAAGVMPLGFIGTVADYRDTPEFRATLRRSRRYGFVCASCVHPAQVAPINEEYRPQPDEVDTARAMIETYADACARGLGAIVFKGKMIDVPVVQRAEALLARHEAIVAREARMKAALGG
ncbi:MAG: CoA ester lyase [Alphaproteobacteria bacterium]|nr:CoA ester lyase [Alphaproteobacteria bacterium]